MAVKNKLKELKEKKKRRDDVVVKFKEEGSITEESKMLIRINDLTDLVLCITEEMKGIKY